MSESRFNKAEHDLLSNMGKKLNDEQLCVFRAVFTALLMGCATPNKLFMLHGRGGSGKTFLYETIIDGCSELKIPCLICAPTGAAATLLKGAKTIHKTFGLPISLRIPEKSPTDSSLKEARIIIIDELSMVSCEMFEAIDVRLRQINNVDEPFGGKTLICGGDNRQIVPIGGEEKSIYTSKWMQLFQHFELVEQMRHAGDPDFSQWLQQIADGGKWAKIPSENRSESMEELLRFVFGPTLCENNGLVLTTRVQEAEHVNEEALQLLQGVKVTFEAYFKPYNRKKAKVEEEAAVNERRFPPKILNLKPSCQVVLLDNIDVSSGLANGTKMKFVERANSELKCETLSGKIVHIKRRSYYPNGSGYKMIQFPLNLSYAATIHKAQGMTLDHMGLFSPFKCFNIFCPGQTYTALSRVRTFKNIRVYSPEVPQGDMVLIRNICPNFTNYHIVDGKWIMKDDQIQ